MVRVITSTSAAARLDAAAAFLLARPPAAEALIVAASRGAADDLARAITRNSGATFGLTRFSFAEFASRIAATAGGPGRVAGTEASALAAATRAAFDADAEHALEYFDPVARFPGFPKALARTLHELRLARVEARDLTADVGPGRAAIHDLGDLLARVEDQFGASTVADRAALFQVAAEACAAEASPAAGGNRPTRWVGLPIVFLDVPLESTSEAGFAGAVAARSPAALFTVPDGDERTLAAVAAGNPAVEIVADTAAAASDLLHLRRYIFRNERPAPRAKAGDVRLFSAPGEGREAIEIVRRALDEAAAGVRFDEMAVFLRTPAQYLGLLEHACARADVPVYFDRGTSRPDPAGRAFLALLACAVEGLSAKRFDEYLSLGQVPRVGEAAANETALADPVPPRDDVYGEIADLFAAGSEDAARTARGQNESAQSGGRDDMDPRPTADGGRPAATSGVSGPEPIDSAREPIDTDDEAIVAGTLRAPWKWEELIVESSVVGGRTRLDGGERWRRRLNGLAADYQYRIRELRREEPESALIKRLERDLRNLTHLRLFALPILDELAAWPDRASWSEWLERFNRLAARGLKRPERVQQVLAELRPMGAITGVALEEAARVLHDRLATLEWDPPARRYGRLFVGTPHQARGRQFRIVFVPGLAERVVPQRPREDPLLLDESRRALGRGLILQDDRAGAERLLLKIAIGAATERVYLSYPRLDSNAEGRARVPSFYALDVMRAVTGTVPDHRVLAREAAEEAGASLGWPAPADPARAIDDLEHDLAVLKPLLDSRDTAGVRGRAHYMLGLNAALKRSITSRWLRDKKTWSASDGLVAPLPALAPYLAAQRLGRRPYSLSALQRFSVCPYQFLLATIHRLEPWTEPEPLVRMDPLTRGSLFHRVQAEFQRELHAAGALPVTRASLTDAVNRLERVTTRVAAEYAEQLAPAIERVWLDEIADLRRDLSIWVQRMADAKDWIPEYFEFSFGLSDDGRDPRSLETPVTVDGRFVLRGSVDLIERHAALDVLRVTDHKTGRNRSNPDLIVGGGGALQPVLYSMAVEQALGKKVTSGRLYYSTTIGGFADHDIPLNDYTRGQALQVLEIVDRAVEQGFLVPAPGERACTWCDFRAVCGPREPERIARKAKDRLADLQALREMR